MAEIIGGRYKLVSLIGRGGMADVYLAEDTILKRDVAIKVLKDEMARDRVALERFAREAKASARLNHPNIVEIYDIGDEGDKHYIVMEYIKGYTLKKLIEVRGAIPYKESVWMIKQLALALLEAHSKGIIHRDVKSQNVLIKFDGTVKMADFGIAQATNDIQITKHDTILGSVHYLAPELTKGKAASMQSDIYSLGIVMYELLTGDVPFKGDSAVQIALKHVNDKIPSVREFNSQIPQAVENIITKATAKDLKVRYENMAYLIKDLETCLKPEHANDKKLVLSDPLEGTNTMEIIDALKDKDMNSKNKGIFSKGLGVVALILLSILSIGALIAVLFLSGIISLPGGSKYTKVPDISGLSLTDAQDVLADSDLVIDYSNIERILTDDIPEGMIISFEPEADEEVYKQTGIKVVVSSGMYSKIDNYVGQKKADVIELLKGTNINAKYKAIESTLDPGTIVSQSIEEGTEFDPSKRIDIVFEVSKSAEIYIENILGLSIEEAQRTLEEAGGRVDPMLKEKSFFNDDELAKYDKPLTVVRVRPNEGSTFVQEADNAIELYYYAEELQ